MVHNYANSWRIETYNFFLSGEVTFTGNKIESLYSLQGEYSSRKFPILARLFV